MILDFIGDGGNSVGAITDFEFLRRQIKSGEYNTMLIFCCIFLFPVWFVFTVLSIVHVIVGGVLESGDAFFGKVDLNQNGSYSLFSNMLKC